MSYVNKHLNSLSMYTECCTRNVVIYVRCFKAVFMVYVVISLIYSQLRFSSKLMVDFVWYHGSDSGSRYNDTYCFFLNHDGLILFSVYECCSFPLELLDTDEVLSLYSLYFHKQTKVESCWILIRRDFKNICQVPLMLSHLSTNSCKILTHLHDIADIWYSTCRQKKQFR